MDKESLEQLQQELSAALPKEESEVTTEEAVDGSNSESTEASQPEYTEIELKAMEQGWNPNYQGEGKKSAEEYVHDGSFFKKISELNKKNKEQEQTLKHLTTHMQNLEKAAYDRARQALLAERDEAIDTGDRTAVHMVEEKIRIQDEEFKQTSLSTKPKIEQELPPEVEAFKERNKSWCNEDTDENRKMVEETNMIANFIGAGHASTVAKLVGVELPKDRDLTLNEKLDLVEAAIKKTFSHRFENPKREKPAMVSGSTTSRSSGGDSFGLSTRLTSMQREIGQQLVRAKACKNLDEYAKQLDSYGALGK